MAFYLEEEQLLRFLRARDFKLAPTVEMHEAWVRWRLTYKADMIRPTEIRELLLKQTLMLGPITKDNKLSLLVRTRYHVPGDHDIDDLMRYGIFCVEQAMKRIKEEDRNPQIACIYDRTGMTGANRDSQIVKMAYRMIGTLQDFYCERLGEFIVIGANTAFWIANGLIKPFLAKKTREKIKLVYKDEELL